VLFRSILMDRKGQPYRKETRYARLSLVSLPFIPVRERLTERMLKEPESPATLMLSLVREKRHKLVIDLKERQVSWKGVQCDMMPAHLALFTFFSFVKKESTCGRESCHGCDDCFLSSSLVLEHQERITSLYRTICSSRCIEEMSDTGVVNLTTENFNSYRSKIARVLEKSFGAHEMKHIDIESRGRKPGVRYGLALDRERISIIL